MQKRGIRTTSVTTVAATLLAAAGPAACGSGSASSAHNNKQGATHAAHVIRAALPPSTGAIDSKDNAGLAKLTSEYEKAHPGVTVQWLPTSTTSISTYNVTVQTQASGGNAPDVVWEQYGAATSGQLPAGLLQNLRPFLEKPDPYVPGNKKWLSLFSASTIPYMESANGDIDIILGSNVETGFYYSKSAFAKAGITSTPKTWAAMMTDLGKLKHAGVDPLLFADGGSCNPSWYERLVASSLMANQTKRFDVDHANVATGKDLAVGVERGVISMSNPRYAEVWKLLRQMEPYFAPGGSSYDACSDPTAVSPPLNPESLLVQGKVGMEWGGSWWIPQLDSQGFSGKYGVFPEPTITSATTPLALNTVTRGLIGGPNGNGEWSVTSQKADKTMTPAKTKTVMNFLAWLFTPPHLGYWIKISQQGGDIPTEPSAPTVNLPGLKSLLPSGKVPTVVLPVLGGLLTSASSNDGLRLLQEYLNGSLSYSSFASQWQKILTTAASTWATQNHFDLSKYK
ncbi:MAG TPA: extracellular solute-binding protein [Acidimicrobiales bacterium]|nr:extracellular solute-binding protein [Acidimicrobiales bacterium]